MNDGSSSEAYTSHLEIPRVVVTSVNIFPSEILKPNTKRLSKNMAIL